MQKYSLILILCLMFIFSKTQICFAKDGAEQILLKEVPKQELIKELEAFVIKNNYSIDSVNNNKTLYYVSVKKKDVVYKLIIDLEEVASGIEISIFNDSKNNSNSFFKNSPYFVECKKLYKQLKRKYPNKYCYMSYEANAQFHITKDIVTKPYNQNSDLIQTLKNKVINDVGIKQINSNDYSKKDPDFVENKELIKKNIHEKGNKKLNYLSVNEISSYSVEIKNKELFYDINGNLKRITITDNEDYPKIIYNYNYPEGNLRDFTIELSKQKSYKFDVNGNNISVDFGPYMTALQDRLKRNWNLPHMSDENIRVVTYLKIAKSGKLLTYKIIKGSNNSLANEAAISAIINSAPFRPLPMNYDEDDVDIQFTFDYKAFYKNNISGLDSLGNKTKADFSPYMRTLQIRIKSNWHPPKSDKNTRVVTFFKIAKSGKLLTYKITKGSDNSSTNEAAINAIIKSAPFAPLPLEYDEDDIDIVFTFDYKFLDKNK
ncbi:MAG: energy transducer TonB [bacterium]